MCRVESDMIGDVRDRDIGGLQELRGPLDPQPQHLLHRSGARLFLEAPGEARTLVAGAHVGERPHWWRNPWRRRFHACPHHHVLAVWLFGAERLCG